MSEGLPGSSERAQQDAWWRQDRSDNGQTRTGSIEAVSPLSPQSYTMTNVGSNTGQGQHYRSSTLSPATSHSGFHQDRTQIATGSYSRTASSEDLGSDRYTTDFTQNQSIEYDVNGRILPPPSNMARTVLRQWMNDNASHLTSPEGIRASLYTAGSFVNSAHRAWVQQELTARLGPTVADDSYNEAQTSRSGMPHLPSSILVGDGNVSATRSSSAHTSEDDLDRAAFAMATSGLEISFPDTGTRSTIPRSSFEETPAALYLATQDTELELPHPRPVRPTSTVGGPEWEAKSEFKAVPATQLAPQSRTSTAGFRSTLGPMLSRGKAKMGQMTADLFKSSRFRGGM